MEADDGDPRPGGEQFGEGLEQGLELLEFVIDGDSEGLEGSCGRVGAAVAVAGGLFDDSSELGGPLDGGVGPGGADGPGNSAAGWFVAELVDEVGKLEFGEGFEQVGRGTGAVG